MLKIKDDVDLKELEKFGFKFDEDSGKYSYNVILKNKNGGITLTVQSWNRKIYLWANINSSKNEEIIEFLYDLIKADLVEKVGE